MLKSEKSKPLVTLSLLGASLFGGENQAQAEEPLRPAVAETKVSLNTTQSMTDFLDAVEKSSRKVNELALTSDDKTERENWIKDLAKINHSIDIIRKQFKDGSLNTELAKATLELSISNLAQWNLVFTKNIPGSQFNIPGLPGPQDGPRSLPFALPNPVNLQNPQVVMDYKDAIALSYFKQYGIPLLTTLWPTYEAFAKEVQDPESIYKKQKGLVPVLSKFLGDGVPKGSTMHDLTIKNVEREKQKSKTRKKL